MSVSSFILSSLLGWLSTNPMHAPERLASSCGTSGPQSCQNTSPDLNTCCYEAPGGLIMQTQFWDTNVPGSPADSWTIHGLWPNNCDGTYMENCDRSRDYKNIGELLSSQGAESTLEYMQQYWLNAGGSSERLWEHEWATHGTCYSTLQVDCISSDSPRGAEAVAYFETVVGLFQTLPTYKWLADAGITPSSSRTHTLSDLLSALEAGSGYTPSLGCRSHTLDSISWYFNLKGSVIDGQFVPINSPESSSCPSSGIRYLPKRGGWLNETANN